MPRAPLKPIQSRGCITPPTILPNTWATRSKLPTPPTYGDSGHVDGGGDGRPCRPGAAPACHRGAVPDQRAEKVRGRVDVDVTARPGAEEKHGACFRGIIVLIFSYYMLMWGGFMLIANKSKPLFSTLFLSRIFLIASIYSTWAAWSTWKIRVIKICLQRYPSW